MAKHEECTIGDVVLSAVETLRDIQSARPPAKGPAQLPPMVFGPKLVSGELTTLVPICYQEGLSEHLRCVHCEHEIPMMEAETAKICPGCERPITWNERD